MTLQAGEPVGVAFDEAAVVLRHGHDAGEQINSSDRGGVPARELHDQGEPRSRVDRPHAIAEGVRPRVVRDRIRILDAGQQAPEGDVLATGGQQRERDLQHEAVGDRLVHNGDPLRSDRATADRDETRVVEPGGNIARCCVDTCLVGGRKVSGPCGTGKQRGQRQRGGGQRRQHTAEQQ